MDTLDAGLPAWGVFVVTETDFADRRGVGKISSIVVSKESVSGVVEIMTNPGPGRGLRVSAAVVLERFRRTGPRLGMVVGVDTVFDLERAVRSAGGEGTVGVMHPPVVAWRLRGSRISRGGSCGAICINKCLPPTKFTISRVKAYLNGATAAQ